MCENPEFCFDKKPSFNKCINELIAAFYYVEEKQLTHQKLIEIKLTMSLDKYRKTQRGIGQFTAAKIVTLKSIKLQHMIVIFFPQNTIS